MSNVSLVKKEKSQIKPTKRVKKSVQNVQKELKNLLKKSNNKPHVKPLKRTKKTPVVENKRVSLGGRKWANVNNNENFFNVPKKGMLNNDVKNIPANLRKECYSKGVSLFDMKTLKLRHPSVLKTMCSHKNLKTNKNNIYTVRENLQNINSLFSKVPPYQERVKAIMKNQKVNRASAEAFAADPFYTFKNPRYFARSPMIGRPNTFPKNHEVWNILPNYFPGPKK